MAFLKKSLIIMTILAVYIAVVFSQAVVDPEEIKDARAGNDICKNSKKALGNGTQNRDGSCVETVMGEIPDVNNMISTLVRNPRDGDKIPANENFTIEVESINLVTGFFDDPVNEYYIFPQSLNDEGKIRGHSHVTVQKLNEDDIPDPRIFAFFKGLNDVANNNILSVLVVGGVPAGKYRLCTMVSSFAHQCVLMPVAQRGAQDDCIRFEAVDGEGQKNQKDNKKRKVQKRRL